MLDELGVRREQLERRVAPWEPEGLGAFLARTAMAHPDRPFVIDASATPAPGGGITVTYAQMAVWAARIARGLAARGIQPGERIALWLPNGAAAIAARFGVALAGAVAVPVHVRLHAHEVAEILAQSHAAALVAVERFRDVDGLGTLDEIAAGWESWGAATGARAEAATTGSGARRTSLRLVVTVPQAGAAAGRPGGLTLPALEREADRELDAELDRRGAAVRAADLATIFFTSGTTGRPKGVRSTHEMELRSAYGSAYTRGFEDGRRVLFALPLNHVFAYVEGLLASMFVGGSVVVQAAFDPVGTLEAIERHRPGEVLFVPTMSLAVVEAARRAAAERAAAGAPPPDLSSLHSVMSAAQSAPARLWEDLASVLGVTTVVTAYGMTETAAATTYTDPGGPVDDLVETVGRPKAGGIAGDPALGGRLVEYATADPASSTLQAPGQPGELVARGPIVTDGYFRRPDETAVALLPGGWLRSGDLGFVRADGALVLTGRSKDLYKCGAEMVMPAEVEAVLSCRPGVAQSYVVGVPDPKMGEVGCAWVVPSEGEQPDAGDLVAACRAALARFKVPAYVLFTDAGSLPLTLSGKVQRFKLAERAVAELGLGR